MPTPKACLEVYCFRLDVIYNNTREEEETHTHTHTFFFLSLALRQAKEEKKVGKTPQYQEMVVDALFDSLCRCLGAPPVPSNTTSNNNNNNSNRNNNHNSNNNTKNNRHNNNNNNKHQYSTKSQPMGLGTSHSDVKRRTERVQLQDKQFDALFTQPPSSPKRTAPSPTTTAATNHNRASSLSNHDGLEQARAVAKAKMVANHRRAKRKSPASQRDDIFRTKQRPPGNPCLSRGANHNHNTSSTSLSSFWSQPAVAHALCFATPIHDTCSSDDDDDDMPPNALTESHTLHTNEDDTVTSTLFFERKYAHVVEHRPPMPLFDQFKVQQDLRRIVATDSHNSLQMMSVFQDYDPATATPLDLDDEEEEDEEEEPPPQSAPPDDWVSSKPKRYCPSDEYQEPPPAVKVLTDSSCSTSSNKSLEHSNHTFRR